MKKGNCTCTLTGGLGTGLLTSPKLGNRVVSSLFTLFFFSAKHLKKSIVLYRTCK